MGVDNATVALSAPDRRESLSWSADRVRAAALATVRHAGELMKRVSICVPVVSAVSRHVTHTEIRRLHDALEPTPIADRYWIIGGLLLGWARQGDVLAHDAADVDFAFRATDYDRLRASTPALVASGFHLLHVWRDNDGELTALTFERSGVHFDFIKMTALEDRLRYRCFFFGVQVTGEVPAQPLTAFELFGKRWLKVADHERELAAVYGDWRTPRLEWRTDRDSPSVTSREPHRAPEGDPSDLSEYLVATRPADRLENATSDGRTTAPSPGES